MSEVKRESLETCAWLIEECLHHAAVVNHFDNRERMDMRKALDAIDNALD